MSNTIGHSFATSTADPPVIKNIRALGFKVFENRDYDMNLIAARNPNNKPNAFDDVLHVLFKVDGQWQHYQFCCTTDPGLYWLHNPMRVAGTACIRHPQQIRSGFTFGMHKGQYDCLVPTKPIPVWRDADRNSTHDQDGDYTSSSIQIHRASSRHQSNLVNKWSAGCIVVANPASFKLFMSLLKHQPHYGLGDKFSLCVIGFPVIGG